MKQTLSDRLLRSLARPRSAPQEIWDQQLRGFGCRASKQGTVSFFAMRRPRGSARSVRIKVGDFPAMSLSDARLRARALLREMQDGVDPRARKAAEARAEVAKQARSFSAVAELFIARHVDRGHPEAARLVFAYARRLFGWAVPRYGLEHAPTDHLSLKDLIGAKAARKRVLNNLEIALLWRATEGPEAAYYGPYARLLLLFGVRRTELGRAIWGEFDLDAGLWTIPPTRMKSDEPHTVPLAPPALEILRALPQGKGYVIGGSPIHYSRSKRELDARMTALNGGKPIPRWTWHDLRRTFRTGLSGLKIAPHIAELAIAHGKQGLSRIYDQHRYDAELREAFALWAQRIMSIVAPPPEKAVLLRKAT